MSTTDWLLVAAQLLTVALSFLMASDAYKRGHHRGYNLGFSDGFRSGWSNRDKESPDE